MSERVSFLNQRLEWTGLGDILRNHLLKVPPYQRSYAWGKAHLEDFWDDLDGSKKEGVEYFMGPIVVASARPPETRMTIIDGQQRLATASILIAVMASNLIAFGDTETADDIDRWYIGEKDIRKRAVTPKLVLNEEDKRFFTSLLTRETGTQPETGSHKRIMEAYNYFKEKVDKDAPQPPAFRDWIIDWIEYIREKAIVMLAVIPDESDAFAIFEALNARGKDLAIADLLKNYLFSCAGSSFADVKASWNSAISNVTDTIGTVGDKEEEGVTDFLRHHWNSKYPLARERELYRRCRTKIRNERDAVEFTADLDKSASYYVALLNPGHDIWREMGNKVTDAVSTLFSLRLEQNRSLLLAALRKMPKQELVVLLPWLLSWSVRGVLVGGIGKGKYEVTYANAALAISDSKASTVDQVYTKLESIIPSDTELEIAFKTYRPLNNKLAHYLLRALEVGLQSTNEPYWIPNPDHEVLTLEHILPRNPNKNQWKEFKTDEVISEYVSRLGNLVLVPKKKNMALGNRPFSTKRKIYQDADLEITKGVAIETTWTPEIVDKRQQELAKLALKVWPRVPASGKWKVIT
jgi:hypothetical protein